MEGRPIREEAFQWFVRGAGLSVGLLVVLLVAGALALSVKVLVLVFLALVLASGLEPVISSLRARLPLGRGAAILISYAGFFLGVLGLAFLIVPGAITQFRDLGTDLQPSLEGARAWASTIEPQGLSASLTAIIDAGAEALTPGGTEAPDPDALLEAGVTVADLAISVASVLALVFFWLTERARMQRFVLALVPTTRRAGARETWNEIEVRLGSWVRGQLILMAAMGIMTTIAYLVLGLEGALLLGLIAAITEAIPIVGPLLGAVPALLVAAMTGRVELVLLVAAVYVVVQLVEGNILVPIVMRNTIGIPPFLVIISVLAGAAIGGIVGALLAVPFVASVVVVLERLQVRDVPIALEPSGATPTPTDEEARPRQLEPSAPARDGSSRPQVAGGG